MDTVRRDDVVHIPHGRLHAHSASLLAGVQMTEAADDLLLVEIAGGRLQTTDRLHLCVVLEGLVLGQFDFRGGSFVQAVQLEGLQSGRALGFLLLFIFHVDLFIL